MPFIANTPESLIGRSDSKNPATTCRGITSTGRPCRRPLAASTDSAPSTPPRRRKNLVVDDDPADESLYCWQHKEQASLSARSSPGPRTSHTPILEERTSIDTLADRLGLLDVSQKPPRKQSRPLGNGPASSVGGGGTSASTRPPIGMTRLKPKKTTSLSFCCFSIPIEEVPPPPSRPKPRPVQPPTFAAPTTPNSKLGRQQQQQHQQYLTPPSHSRPSRSSLPSGTTLSPGGGGGSQQSGRRRHSSASLSPGSPASTATVTTHYMSLIPASASPQTASLLLAELAKPVSQLDDPGYIYMFWLTPESASSAPPADAARSLLVPPPATPTRPGGQRRVSDVLASFAAPPSASSASGQQQQQSPQTRGRRSSSAAAGTTTDKTILLKIGRATNVQRRLNEWKRQCGYNLSLIRYYPYIPSSSSSPSPSPSGSGGNSSSSPGSSSPGTSGAIPRKVPHSHRVERLIHIELEGMGMRVSGRDCDACGRSHREWFEVDASRKGVEAVDELIRRWVEWDEGIV